MHVNHAAETLLAKLNTSLLHTQKFTSKHCCNTQCMQNAGHVQRLASCILLQLVAQRRVSAQPCLCSIFLPRQVISLVGSCSAHMWGHAVHTCGVMQCTHVGSCSAHTTVVISSHAYCKHGACHIGKVNIHCFLLKQSVTAIVNAVAFPCVAAALQ